MDGYELGSDNHTCTGDYMYAILYNCVIYVEVLKVTQLHIINCLWYNSKLTLHSSTHHVLALTRALLELSSLDPEIHFTIDLQESF